MMPTSEIFSPSARRNMIPRGRRKKKSFFKCSSSHFRFIAVYFLIAFFESTLCGGLKGQVAMSGKALIIDNCLLKH